MTASLYARLALAAAVAVLPARVSFAAEQRAPVQGANRSVSVVDTPDGGQAVIVRDRTMRNGDVTSTAGKYDDGTLVAVTGTVASTGETDFILNRPDGQVRAVMSDGASDLGTGYTAALTDEIQPGRSVTVYGRLHRVPLDLTQIEVEGVYDNKTEKFTPTPLGKSHFAQRASRGRVELHYQPL